jgi:hypothetical protein
MRNRRSYAREEILMSEPACLRATIATRAPCCASSTAGDQRGGALTSFAHEIHLAAPQADRPGRNSPSSSQVLVAAGIRIAAPRAVGDRGDALALGAADPRLRSVELTAAAVGLTAPETSREVVDSGGAPLRAG